VKDSWVPLCLDNFVVVVDHYSYVDLHYIVVVYHCVSDSHNYLLYLVLKVERVVDDYNDFL